MTTLRIPALPGGKASVRLVYRDAPHDQVLGFDGHDWATEYRSLAMDEEQVIDLIPSAEIATLDGRPTGYLITVTASGNRRWDSVIQIEDRAEVQDLDVVISADRVSPGNMKAIFLGGARIEVVDSIPDPEMPGVIYFVTG